MRLNNGFEIPQIGVGTWTLRGETARQNVCLALKAGFRHVDTAQGYENEAEVGQGIADSGVPRQEIFVTTKVNTGIMRMGKQAVADSIDESLAKLNTDYIDLLLIHWPVKDCVRLTWQVMEDYVRQGKARSVLQSLAKKYQKTASQIVLRWIVQRGLITIPRAKPNHFAENLEVMAFSLSDEDMLAISALNQNLRSNVLNDPETFPW